MQSLSNFVSAINFDISFHTKGLYINSQKINRKRKVFYFSPVSFYKTYTFVTGNVSIQIKYGKRRKKEEGKREKREHEKKKEVEEEEKRKSERKGRA